MHWFVVTNTKQLRKLGLDGPHVFGMNAPGGLELRGETAGNLFITSGQIIRARTGFYETRSGRFYTLKLWTTLTPKTIQLQPTRASWTGYRTVINEFVRLMLTSEQRDVMETGSSKFDALFGPILMGIPTLGAILIAVFVLTDQPWWGRLVVPLIPVIVFSLLTWMGVTRYWPRPLIDITQLPKQLPPVLAQAS